MMCTVAPDAPIAVNMCSNMRVQIGHNDKPGDWLGRQAGTSQTCRFLTPVQKCSPSTFFWKCLALGLVSC
jgi:hypothetical protein